LYNFHTEICTVLALSVQQVNTVTISQCRYRTKATPCVEVW